ncbi:PAS domain S-box protein [Lacibacter luteus]|uniref:histidine kinase n=1 Tax=Lacibacter luteus TaxID=2508719 RepID=A0A4Q1CMN9_9BACT|nr:PAS domain S-box protein [Lacibacter luteus]RXK62313.1 PAS domain S-box protein [Lacibacter luteus]
MELSPFFELTLDLVFVAGRDGFCRKVNKAVVEKLGYTQEELFARPIADFMHSDDRASTKVEREKLLNGVPLVNFQNRYVTKQGTVVWLEWTSIYLPDEEVVFAIAKDITVRKLAELEVEAKYNRVKSMVGHFKGNIERDRKYLSVALHEELAQLLAVLKIDIDWIKAREEILPALINERLQHATAITELLMKTIQRISFSISPGMLQDLGLVETLRWHCNEFSVISSISFRLEADMEDIKINKDLQLDLFRICQEALHNIVYHAEASEAIIRIEETEKMILLTISDNGKGFQVNQQTNTPGLNVMQERAASIHADFEISSTAGSGTKISVALPLN